MTSGWKDGSRHGWRAKWTVDWRDWWKDGKKVLVDGWMERWVDVFIERWVEDTGMGGWMNEGVPGRLDEMDGYIDRGMGEGMVGEMSLWTNGRMRKWLQLHTSRNSHMIYAADKWKNGLRHGWTVGWRDEWMDGWNGG